MIIKPFNLTWIILILLQVAVLFFINRKYRNKTRTEKLNFIKIFSICSFVYLFLYKTVLAFDPNYVDSNGMSLFNFWNELPLKPCNFVTWFSIICASRDYKDGECFCFVAGLFFTLMGMTLPAAAFKGISLFSRMGLGFWLYHASIIVLSCSYVVLGIYEPGYRDLYKPVLMFLVFMIPVHILNIVLSKTVFPDASYFWTRGYLEGSNPVFELCRKLIDVDFVYLFPLLLAAFIPFSLEIFVAGLFRKKTLKSN